MGRKRHESAGRHEPASEYLRLALTAAEPQIDRQREIATALHAAARKLGWRVADFHWNEIARSYHWADVQHGDKHFAVLFEQGSRVTALAERITNYLDQVFFDDSAFCETVKELGEPFVVASASDLTRDLTIADRLLIDKYPHVVSPYDMKHWKPRTVGGVLFNFWD